MRLAYCRHRHHRHRLHAARYDDVVKACLDRPRGQRNRLKPARAEAVDGHPGGFFRQAAEPADHARHVHALLALGECAAENQVLHRRRIHVRVALQQLSNDLARELIRTPVRQGPLLCAPNRASNRIYDDNLTHVSTPDSCWLVGSGLA